MNLELVYKSRPYLFEVQKDNIGGGEEIVQYLVSQTEFGGYDSIEFLCSNYEYDAYFIMKDGAGYCIKYSFDSSNLSLKNEFKILQQLHPISPRPIIYNKIKFGDELHFSILSYEFASNVKDFGLACLSENWDSFFSSYGCIDKVNCDKTFADYLNSFYQDSDLKSLPEDALSSIKEYYDFSIIEKLFNNIRFEINSLCKNSFVKKSNFCHGRLQPSNILFRDGEFKMIDFTNSYSGNAYLDLARLAIFCGFESSQEKEMITSFLKSKGKIFAKEDWEEYRCCYDVMIRLVFLELLSTYLKEVYLYSSFRPIKIFNVIEIFAKNNKAFFRLPHIIREHEFVYKMLLEPIIGKE